MKFFSYLTRRIFVSQTKFLLLLFGIIILSVIFIPLPSIQTSDTYCEPCVDRSDYDCPICPKKGDIIWQESIATQFTQKYLPRASIQPTEPVIEEDLSPGPRMEKLPWENSTCGNSICEICESSDSCCNYPPKKDKNGTMIYPPPTCLGHCVKDCPIISNTPGPSPFPLDDTSARYYIKNNYLWYESKDNPKHPTAIVISENSTAPFQQFEGKDVVVEGAFVLQTKQVECINDPCPPMKFTVIRIDSIRLK